MPRAVSCTSSSGGSPSASRGGRRRGPPTRRAPSSSSAPRRSARCCCGWVVVAGFALLGLWQLATAVTVHGAADRLKSVGKGVGYLALAGVAARVALNAGGGGEEQTQSLTATAMQHPLGIVAVVVVRSEEHTSELQSRGHL